jgi:hypothetical protein
MSATTEADELTLRRLDRVEAGLASMEASLAAAEEHIAELRKALGLVQAAHLRLVSENEEADDDAS